MSLATKLFRSTNHALRKVGLKIDKLRFDYDARLDNAELQGRAFKEIGDAVDEWLASQDLFVPKTQFSSADAIKVFFEAYMQNPFKDMDGGSRFNNLVWLHLVAKSLNPKVIIDSGTFRGASAWALSLGAPDAKVYSFDIDLSRLVLRVNNVKYSEYDWTQEAWDKVDLSDTLIYFDDHLDQAKRLIEASEHGIDLAVFDDDYPVTSFASNVGGTWALPKIEFLLDDDLRRYKEIGWTVRGVHYKIPVDAEYWNRARALIGKTTRLPNTSLITGIHQTPYRIIKVVSSRKPA